LPFNIFDWENVQIITEFETAMRNAVRRVLPECRLIGCWFNFSQVCILYPVELHFKFNFIIKIISTIVFFYILNILIYLITEYCTVYPQS